ncbi:MAG TPA: fibronectin type III domain-containing protein [Trebonia sp.]|nr:fibronectin type III domain-containing protein [Trebonia sp.]
MSSDVPASVPDPVSAPDAVPQPTWSVAPPPWQVTPSPPRQRPKPPKWLLPAGAGVLAIILVVGLVIWAPWSPRPVAPATLTATSPTGTSIRLSWPVPKGGATPDHYVILRDGAKVAEVPASATSWTNTGLMPGDRFKYEVATQGDGRQSGPSPVASVTTLAPSPVGLKVSANYSTATLTWKPSPLGPAPDKYEVYNGPNQVTTVSGSTTSYVAQGQSQGAAFQYTVVAEWGTAKSAPSAADIGSIRSAPLNALVNVNVTPTSIPSGGTGATVGKALPESWYFTPQCAANACTMTVEVAIPAADSDTGSYNIKVSPSGANYTGSIKAKFAKCSTTQTTDTIAVTLTPDKSGISNGAWGKWTGTLVATMPYTSMSSGYYCPEQSWDFNVSSTGS